MATYRMVLIVPAADRDAANADAALLDADVGGADTLGVPLRPVGSEATSPTHYGANGAIGAEARGQIRGPLTTKYPDALVYDCEALGWDPEQAWRLALTAAGLEPTPGPEMP